MTPWLCGLRIQANHVIIKELEIPYQATTCRHCTTHWQVFNPPELGGDLIFDNYHQFLQNSEMTEPPVPVLSKTLNGKLAVSWHNWRQKNQQFYWRLFDWFLDFWRYQNRTGSQMFENHSYYISGNSYRIFFRTTFIYMFETHSEKAPVINVHSWKLPNIGIYSKTPDFLQTMGHKSWSQIAPSRTQMSIQDKRLSPSPGSSLIIWIAATKQQYITPHSWYWEKLYIY